MMPLMNEHRPRVWVSQGTIEEVSNHLQRMLDEDGLSLDGSPRFQVLAMTQSPCGQALTLLILRRARAED